MVFFLQKGLRVLFDLQNAHSTVPPCVLELVCILINDFPSHICITPLCIVGLHKHLLNKSALVLVYLAHCSPFIRLASSEIQKSKKILQTLHKHVNLYKIIWVHNIIILILWMKKLNNKS